MIGIPCLQCIGLLFNLILNIALQCGQVLIITKYKYEIPSSDCLNKLKLTNLEDRRNQHLLINMYKVYYYQVPVQLSNIFTRTSQQHSYNTRSDGYNFVPPKPKTNYLKKSFSYRGSVAWNNLPNEHKGISSFNTFKCRVKNK